MISSDNAGHLPTTPRQKPCCRAYSMMLDQLQDKNKAG